jgi:uncharacterized membrane protein YpjA
MNIIYSILAIIFLLLLILSKFEGEIFRNINIVLLILMGIIFVIGLINEIIMHRQINKELNENMFYKEKMTILGTYPSSIYRTDYNKKLKLVGVLLIIAILFDTFIFVYMPNYSITDSKYFNLIFFGTILSILGILCLAKIRMKNNNFKLIGEIVREKYSNAVINKLNLIQSDEEEYTNQENQYQYEIIIDKYNCRIVNYHVFEEHYDHSVHRNRRDTIADILLYEYVLPVDTSIDIIIDSESNDYKKYELPDQLKKNIAELSKSRIFKIIIKGNYVEIKNYIKIDDLMNKVTEEEIRKNINDIEVFYHLIVEKL